MKKRIMIDMSATLIHHGHIRLIKKAKSYGDVIIGLTTDEEILSSKGYNPEIPYEFRKEVLEAIKGVSEVVPTSWLITNETLEKYNIDLLVHGEDNSNPIDKEKLIILPRTEGISSSMIRKNSVIAVNQLNNDKLMLTPGPAALPYQNLKYLKPLFGRGDDEYTNIYQSVKSWVKELSGQDEVVISQGSSTFSIELAAHSFVQGKVLLIDTGYYSQRMAKLLPKGCQLKTVNYDEFFNINEDFDWVCCSYTETSTAFKASLPKIKDKTLKLNAKLFVDSTGSIGLEENHHLCDLTAFSSCKGLLGMTGASFIAHKKELKLQKNDLFYFNYETQKNHMVTGAYHAVASLYGIMPDHSKMVQRIRNSKDHVLATYSDFIKPTDPLSQPLLCTYLEARIEALDDKVILYSPRSNLPGSIICHFGEIITDKVELDKRIFVKKLIS